MESTLIDELIRMDPLDVLRSLKDVKPTEPPFNWELLREIASSRAVADGGSRAEKMGWAAVAVRAAEGGQVAELIDSESASRGIVMVKAKLISQLGPERGDAILDLGELMAWFAKEVEDLDADAEWPLNSTPVEVLRAGRRIKNDLVALSPLVEDSQYSNLPAMSTVKLWWSRRETLP